MPSAIRTTLITATSSAVAFATTTAVRATFDIDVVIGSWRLGTSHFVEDFSITPSCQITKINATISLPQGGWGWWG